MTDIHRFTKREIAYLEYLASDTRPKSFDGITLNLITPLEKLGLIEATHPQKPPMTRWWNITERGRAVVRSLSKQP